MTKNLTFCQKSSFERWAPAKGFTIVKQCATEQCRAYYFRIRSIKVAQASANAFKGSASVWFELHLSLQSELQSDILELGRDLPIATTVELKLV